MFTLSWQLDEIRDHLGQGPLARWWETVLVRIIEAGRPACCGPHRSLESWTMPKGEGGLSSGILFPDDGCHGTRSLKLCFCGCSAHNLNNPLSGTLSEQQERCLRQAALVTRQTKVFALSFHLINKNNLEADLEERLRGNFIRTLETKIGQAS